jgi:hypothetical protein
LKDEPLSQEKVDALKTRVFNTVPMAYNFLLKKYTGPIAVFMRKHPEFFESACGMNINSLDLDAILAHALRVTSGQARFGAGDYKSFDIRLATVLREAEVKTWREMGWQAGYSTSDQNRMVQLVIGTIFTTRFVKNDVFLMWWANVSGVQITLDCNGICNSLCFRFCWHSERERLGLPYMSFRVYVFLLVMGDDNVWGVAVSVEWFTFEVVVRMMALIGQEYTGTDKKEITDYRFIAITEVSFLKRTFVRRGQRWIAPIEKKSLVKMLTMAKASDLTRVDHGAVLLGNVVRECFFHERSFFDSMRAKIIVVGVKYGLDKSSLFSIADWDTLEERFSKGDYPRWGLGTSEDFGSVA